MTTFSGFVMRSKLSPTHFYSKNDTNVLTTDLNIATLFETIDQVPDTMLYKNWEQVFVQRTVNTIELDIL
jgi:hypothetical protein